MADENGAIDLERVEQTDEVTGEVEQVVVGELGRPVAGAVAALVGRDHAEARRCQQRRDIDKTMDVVRPSVQENDGRPIGGTCFRVPNVQDPGIDLLQRSERCVRPGFGPGRPRGLCFCSYAKGSRNRRKGSSADEIAAVPVYVGF